MNFILISKLEKKPVDLVDGHMATLKYHYQIPYTGEFDIGRMRTAIDKYILRFKRIEYKDISDLYFIEKTKPEMGNHQSIDLFCFMPIFDNILVLRLPHEL